LAFTVMSKRRLTEFVARKIVDGWDDPRFPTVRGLLRRGLTVEGLRAFVEIQGMSKVVNLMEWGKIWSINREVIDPISPRYTAVAARHKVRLSIANFAESTQQEGVFSLDIPRHKKNPSLGIKTVWRSPTIFLEEQDVVLCNDGEEVTLMDWGNCFIHNIQHDPSTGLPVRAEGRLNLKGDFKATKWKLHFVPEVDGTVDGLVVEYDHLLIDKKIPDGEEVWNRLNPHSKLTLEIVGEPALKSVKKGDIIQLERRGFMICDNIRADGTPVFFDIPDGKGKINHLSARKFIPFDQDAGLK